LKAGEQREESSETVNRDTAEVGASQVWCAGTGGALVGQKGKSRKGIFDIKKTTLQGERRFLVSTLFPASPLLIPMMKLP
jgi:hypothetical protein